jgi:hypothetical protein
VLFFAAPVAVFLIARRFCRELVAGERVEARRRHAEAEAR